MSLPGGSSAAPLMRPSAPEAWRRRRAAASIDDHVRGSPIPSPTRRRSSIARSSSRARCSWTVGVETADRPTGPRLIPASPADAARAIPTARRPNFSCLRRASAWARGRARPFRWDVPASSSPSAVATAKLTAMSAWRGRTGNRFESPGPVPSLPSPASTRTATNRNSPRSFPASV